MRSLQFSIIVLFSCQVLSACVTPDRASDTPSEYVTLEPVHGPILRRLIDFERYWLTKGQAADFARYLNIINKGRYPVGLFIAADDEASAWHAWHRTKALQTVSVRRTFEDCQKRSTVPRTCRIFAVNGYMVATGRAVSAETLAQNVLIRPTEVAQIEAARRTIRVDWKALGPPFELVVVPAFERGNFRFEISEPSSDIVCTVQGVLKTDHDGKWQIGCDNGLRAAGEASYVENAKFAIISGKDTEGGEVLILSTPLPENIPDI